MGLYSAFATTVRPVMAYIFAVALLAGIIILAFWGKRAIEEKKEKNNLLSKQGKLKSLVYEWLGDKQKLLWMGIAVVILFWMPYLFRADNIHVRIFDNLDCHIPQTKVLAESGKAFSLDPDTKLDNFIDGLPLSGVDSGYNVLTWLFMLLPPLLAYAVNDLLVRLAALFGMVLLLRHHIFKAEINDRYFLIVGAASCFALLPFYPAGGVSVAGIPMLLYAFLNLLEINSVDSPKTLPKPKSKQKLLEVQEPFLEKVPGGRRPTWRRTDLLIIVFFPFYSKLALAGFFITVGLFIIWVVDIIRKRKINYYYMVALALLTVTYVFTHYHLVHSFLDANFVSFREEIRAMTIGTGRALSETVHNFIFDRVNEVGAHHMFVLAAAAAAVWIKIKKKEKDWFLTGLVVLALFNAFLWGFKYWEGTISFREKYQVLNAFDFSRFYWLNPFLWYLIFALSLFIISRVKFGKIIASLFIVGQLLYMFVNYNWEYRHMLGVQGSFAGSRSTYSLTFREFFSPGLFKQIDQHIDRPKSEYRVVSLGLHPGVSQYNGFYTLDIYTDIYPLSYKHAFRKIMEKELAKNPEMARGFDSNAKRCFLMVSELHGNKAVRGMMFTRGITKYDQHLSIKHLELNTEALKALGGEYIISAVEIRNAKENRLILDGIFKSNDSPWKIFLYRAK